MAGHRPQPPSWKYQPGDVRAFERYERKVKLWQMQIRFYMTRAEAGLMLYSSLSGEAEQQLEFADMSKIFHEDGVQFVLDQLKSAFQQKSVYVKRHVLHEYEHIYRQNLETLRGFINRYRRIEASLMSIGIDVSLTYDNEARGSRLLDRAKLTLEQQRMVLVGTGQRMDFESVASALCMQFPEYRPAPPVAGKGDHQKGKGDSRGNHHSGQSPHQQQHRRHDGKFGSQQHRSQKVFETVVEDPQEEADDAAPEEGASGFDEEGQPDPEHGDEEHDVTEDAEGDNNDFEDLARVLTVTAKKLAAMTQGRKFRNGPKKSIEQRKQESPCAACGELGHWAGDEQCKVSGGKSSSGKGKTKPKGGKSDAGGKKVFTVNHYTGFQTEEPWDEHQEFPPHSVMVVFSTTDKIPLVSNMEQSAHYMILDTACQRSCCGFSWYQHHDRLLKNIENENGITLPTFLHHQRELFQFGAGDKLAHFPMGVQEQCCYLGASILEAGIPFLGSLSMMSKLGFILDIPNNRVAISALACEVQLVNLDGNMAIDITQFPKAPQLLDGRVAESMLHDKEVNFVLMSSQPVDPLACTDSLPAATARTTHHSSAATSFKTSVKSSFRSHGPRKCSSRRMANTCDPTASVPEEGLDPTGSSMENGHGGGHNLRDAELFKCENSLGNVFKISDSTEGQLTNDHALGQSQSMQPTPSSRDTAMHGGGYTRCKTCHQRWKWNEDPRQLEVGWILLQTLAAATCALDSNEWTLAAAVNHVIPRQLHQNRTMPAARLRDQWRCPYQSNFQSSLNPRDAQDLNR